MVASRHSIVRRALLVLALVAGCATTIETGSHADPAARFNAEARFAWIAARPCICGDPAIRPSPAVEAAIESSIRMEIEARSYHFVADREQADFVIGYTIGAREEIQPEDYPTEFRGFMSWHIPGNLQSVREPYAHTYTEGTLGVDVFDAATGKPVWHGWAQKTITAADRRHPEASVRRGLERLFREFPRAGS